MSPPADQTAIRTCPLCEAMCGLRVSIQGGRVQKIRPDPEDVWSRGYICPKGTALGELQHDPDRLRAPMIREGDGFRAASWEEAFARVEELLRPVIERDGIEAVTAYIGNPTAHNFSLSRYVGAFVAMAGLPVVYSAGTVDQWPKNLSSALMYGDMWSIPTPDLDRCDFLIMLGANPSASQGSLLAAADVPGRLDAIRERGGKLIVIDPRRTKTADRADEWIPIQPGTDAALLLAMAQVLFEEALIDLGPLASKSIGLEKLEAVCRDFTPESVASTCRIPAETIRRLARELAAAERGAVYGRIGTCNQEFGTLASWIVDALNAITGNLDQPGGAMFSNPIAWSMTSLRPPDQAEGWNFDRFRSRVRGVPEALGQFPVSCLAEEIATPGKGQIKALVTIAGNPVISAPDAGKLDEALPQLECMISLDNYINETTRHAHVILPGMGVFEQPHYDELLWRWAVRNAGKYCDPIFAPESERPDEWQVLLTLTAILAGQASDEVDTELLDNLYFSGLVATVAGLPGSRIAGREATEIVALTEGEGPLRLLDFAIRIGPWGEAYGALPDGLTLAKLREQPHGIDMGPLEPRIDEILVNASGKLDLAPDYIVQDLPRLLRRLERSDDGLVLVSRRHLRSNNSWMHNLQSLMTGKDRCTLLIHPDDARRVGLSAGDAALVSSKAGSVEVPVEISDEMMPGVVCLPHGWGHDRPGAKLSVAERHAGVNSNLLNPGDLVDVPSGNAIVNGVPVDVAPA